MNKQGWTKQDFLSILETDLAKALFKDKEIAQYVAKWREENKAALLHANGIIANTAIETTKSQLQLVAAFEQKNVKKIAELIAAEVPVGVRLDYLLPLYADNNEGGEDIFVASTKIMLKGDPQQNVNLSYGQLVHKLGKFAGTNYSKIKLQQLEQYVNDAFVIRKLLQNAPNKTIVQPTPEAVEYIITNAKTYYDSNDNPTIVFIPGALAINNYSIPNMIERTINYGADINQIGLFGVTGIVWSIILGDVEAVQKFIEFGAKTNIEDEMGNKNVLAWACSTYTAVETADYRQRLFKIIAILKNNCALSVVEKHPNNLQMAPLDYLAPAILFELVSLTKQCVEAIDISN